MTDLSPTIRIWDAPLRLFHWTLAIAGIGAIVSGLSDKTELVGLLGYASETVDWGQVHTFCGYVILIAILWRILWGLVGSETAKLKHLLPTPRTLLSSLRDLKTKPQGATPKRYLGHDPVAGFAAVCLLLLFVGQAFGGLFIADDSFFEGPLYGALSSSSSDLLASLHTSLGELLPWIIGLHVAAIVAYRLFGKINLLWPMITGRTPRDSIRAETAADQIEKAQKPTSYRRAAACLIAATSAIYGLTSFKLPSLF